MTIDKRTDGKMAAYLGFEKRLIHECFYWQFHVSNPGTSSSRLPADLDN